MKILLHAALAAMLCITSAPAYAWDPEEDPLPNIITDLTGDAIGLCDEIDGQFCYFAKALTDTHGGLCATGRMLDNALAQGLPEDNILVQFPVFLQAAGNLYSTVTLRHYNCTNENGDDIFDHGVPIPSLLCITPGSGNAAGQLICTPATIEN